ncbi:WhiB family transcriptional regulator [Streptomyces sp. NPDC060187]|uniref:WhiB family transcriptional regulator n=1 Tax=Streptomyces sp. NPDC060187 TaxID=3347067 RepID=UPI0036502AC5
MYWRERAECLGIADPDLFFPVGRDGPTLVQIDQAKVVCRRCPVTEQCLALALRMGQVQGIWGGTTEAERRALHRRDVRPLGPKGIAA